MTVFNKTFWKYWNDEKFEEALQCSVPQEEHEHRKGENTIFNTELEQRRQNKAVTLISVGEFLHDYIMINPIVVEGLDFARSENLSHLFSLSHFANKIDLQDPVGDMAQLQGYVAEQFMAVELQAMGYDVEFPEESNNPGWDLILDGQPFQVKSMMDPGGIKNHLDTYPDIPVYVNAELADEFADHPQVYISNISKAEIDRATYTTLDHASDLMNFEIPLIAFSVSSISNIKRVLKGETLFSQAALNVFSDTSARVITGAAGKYVGTISLYMIFGPAGGITGSVLGVYIGASQGGKLSNTFRQFKAKREGEEMVKSFKVLLRKIIKKIDKKISIKEKKIEQTREKLLRTHANKILMNEMEKQYRSKKNYLINRKNQLININSSEANKPSQILDCLQRTMSIIAKTGVHPYHFQEELSEFQLKTVNYCKKL